MSEEWNKYLSDPRTVCKYGEKCYQKNAEHHKIYKHPPKSTKRKGTNLGNQNKRLRVNRVPKPPTEAAASSSTENTIETNRSLEPMKTPANAHTPDRVIVCDYHEATTDNKLYKEIFLVKMPEDFFKFYECLDADCEDIDKFLNSINMQLIGPYDLLLGKLPVSQDKELYLVHWRFYYDPPEFQAVIKSKGKSEFHIGYFRDCPDEDPVFLASNDSSKDCHLTPLAPNIFGAVYNYLLSEKKKSPILAMACQKAMDKVKVWAEKHNYSLDRFNTKQRLADTVTKAMHGAGILVPYDKKTQLGYRSLVESEANIKKMFNKLKEATTETEKNQALSELQPVITYASIAVDECDFGTGLELGIALFSSGLKELESSALSAFLSVYTLLNRDAFGKIIQTHMKQRRRGARLSVTGLLGT